MVSNLTRHLLKKTSLGKTPLGKNPFETVLKVEFIWKTDSEYLTAASVANEPSSAHLSMVKYPNSPRTDAVTFTCYLIADGTLAATRSVTERMQFGGEF